MKVQIPLPPSLNQEKWWKLVINVSRERRKCNIICGVPVTYYFSPFLSYFTGHVFEPFVRKCGECKLALFWGKIVVSGAVLINFVFQQEFHKDCFSFFQFNFFFFLALESIEI